MTFRYDINGLRAISVIAVVIFHFFPDFYPGGFFGVDVFFILSGYLMTQIILCKIRDNSFNLLVFYTERARRILPALSVMSVVLLVWGWFNLFNVEYSILAKHLLSSVVFLSNIIYWFESGYFDADAYQKWVLHTWSLSVEWQFYIFYPLALSFLLFILNEKFIKWVLVFLCFFACLFSIFAAQMWPSAAYYLLPARGWEMLLGGVVFFFQKKIDSSNKFDYYLNFFSSFVSFLLCFFLLGFGFFISSKTSWPNVNTVIILLCVAVYLALNMQNIGILKNKFIQYIGSCSYSIYLWHWPLAVYVKNNFPNDFWLNVFFIFLSFLFGVFSYHYFERFRYWFWIYVLSVIFSVLIFNFNGNVGGRYMSDRIENIYIKKYDNYKLDSNGYWNKCNARYQLKEHGRLGVDPICVDGNKGGVMLWGDSHAAALSIGLRDILGDTNNFYQLASSTCGASLHKKRPGSSISDRGCNYTNELAYKKINAIVPDTIVIAKSSGHEEMEWDKTVEDLKEMGVDNVIIVGPVPQWKPSLPQIYYARHNGEKHIVDDSLDQSIIRTNNLAREKYSNIEGLIYIDLISYLCEYTKEGSLSCLADLGEELLIFDGGHLTDTGSMYIGREILRPYILKTLDKI